jgi:hypothetical protein
MNSQPEILNPATPERQIQTPSEDLLTFQHRGNGKVARLPKPIRDQINQMLLDGLSYAEVIERLGEQGKDLRTDNIGEWKRRGYQDWLLQREWLEQLTSKSSFSTDILAAPETSGLHEAGLRFAAAQMFDQLMRFNAALNTPDSQDTSDKFSRLVNALSRLNRAALAFKKYDDLCAKEKALELKELDPDRDPSENECAAWARRMDRFFMMPYPQPVAPKPADGSSSPSTINPQP